jgi:hypothetical protein
MAKRRRGALAQAQAEAALQYGPQRRELHGALTDAGRTRQNDVRAAQISGGALAHQIRESLPGLVDDYRLAARVGDVNNNDVLRALAGQSGVGAYLATIRGDRALNATLGARELANAKGSLRLQANQALQGAVNDVANVRSNYQSLAGKIRSQLAGLTADQAKYVALNVPKIEAAMAADARAAQAARDAHRAAVDKHHAMVTPGLGANGKPLGKDAAGILGATVLGSGPVQKVVAPYKNIKLPPPKPHLTGDQKGTAISEIQRALEAARAYKPRTNKGFRTLRSQLLTGYKARGPGETDVPKLSHAGQIPNSTLAQAALDLYRYGHLSRGSYAALYGVPVPRPWRPPSSRQMSASRSAARRYLPGARLIYG